MSSTGLQIINIPGVVDNRANLYFAVINASNDDITLDMDGGEYLYPQNTNFPRVPLSALAEDFVIAANTERGFTLVMADPDDEIRFAAADNVGNGVLYYSMPAAADACGARGFADDTSDATRNNCNPFRTCDADQTLNRETNMCEGGGDPGNGGGGGNNNTPPVGDNPRTSTPPQRGKADFAQRGGVVVGLMGFMVALYYLGGGAEDFSFSPDFGYAITESGYSYKYGGRVDFRKDAWSLYWTAGQRNANGDWGDFRYASGGEYDGGFWRAAFSESVAGETANYNFSLSADYTGGIWKVSPTYRFRSQLKKGESESGNALNLEAALAYNRWIVRPSAGFRWRRMDDFGDNAKFGITAVRRF